MFSLIHLKFPCPSSWLWEMHCAISPLPTTQRLHLNLLKSCDSMGTFTCTASAPHFAWGEVTKGSSALEFLMASVTLSFLSKNIKSVLLHLSERLIWYSMSSIKIFSCSISNNIVAFPLFLRAYPIDQYPCRTRQAAAIMLMIMNNLDPAVAQVSFKKHLLSTYWPIVLNLCWGRLQFKRLSYRQLNFLGLSVPSGARHLRRERTGV